MGVIGSSRTDSNATFTGGIEPVKNPVIYNAATSGSPNTETSVALSTLKSFIVINRGTAQVNLAFAPGASGTVYLSISPGNFHAADNIDDQSITLYVQSSLASQRLEIVTWS